MANYKTGAEMHPTAKVETGIGWIAVTVGDGYYEVYIDKKLQKSAFNGQTRSCAVDPGDHLVGVYSAGRWVVNETIHVPAEGETVPEPEPAPEEAHEAEAADKPAPDAPEEPAPDQPAGEPAGPEYTLVKTETLELLIKEMRDLAAFLEALLPIGKTE